MVAMSPFPPHLFAFPPPSFLHATVASLQASDGPRTAAQNEATFDASWQADRAAPGTSARDTTSPLPPLCHAPNPNI
ncbi:unnamed protein product [Pleuronectes platessa]|uniref:Uncharacterized protein n=1 Tax=Pleuronectes platessa TaxID=8262 RepID=A0A9N7VSR8_PLEPL|nr:unnamed protein product [Pleuronectes platessa]